MKNLVFILITLFSISAMSHERMPLIDGDFALPIFGARERVEAGICTDHYQIRTHSDNPNLLEVTMIDVTREMMGTVTFSYDEHWCRKVSPDGSLQNGVHIIPMSPISFMADDGCYYVNHWEGFDNYFAETLERLIEQGRMVDVND